MSLSGNTSRDKVKRRENTNFKTASARNCSQYIGRFRHRRVPVDMKSKLGETRKSVHFFTRRGDVNKTKFPTKQANRNLKGALCKNVHIISADFFIGRSAMSTRTGGASPPGPPLFFILRLSFNVLLGFPSFIPQAPRPGTLGT